MPRLFVRILLLVGTLGFCLVVFSPMVLALGIVPNALSLVQAACGFDRRARPLSGWLYRAAFILYGGSFSFLLYYGVFYHPADFNRPPEPGLTGVCVVLGALNAVNFFATWWAAE